MPDKSKEVKKGFFKKFFEKLDKHIEQKSKAAPCCWKKDEAGKKSCCS